MKTEQYTQNKRSFHAWLSRSAGLKCLFIYAHFLRRAILTRKVGQTDLVFGVLSGFISKSVHARLQVSVCSGYDLCHGG